MSGGKVNVLPINANETVYHFDEDDNLTTSGDKISTADLVTRVKVIGLEKKTQKRSVEATLDGKTEYGIRQRIYTRSSDDTAAQAKSAAQKTLDEKGRTYTENHPERRRSSVHPQGRQNPGCGQDRERLLHCAGSAARCRKPHNDHDR